MIGEVFLLIKDSEYPINISRSVTYQCPWCNKTTAAIQCCDECFLLMKILREANRTIPFPERITRIRRLIATRIKGVKV